MAGSSFGKLFRVSTWGESHGPALGVVIDGCPAGLPISTDDLSPYLSRRRPGDNKYATARNEKDEVEILSGVFEGMTTGTPISLMIRNTDQRSRDYGNLASVYRPGHADYAYDVKYGIRDYRGGGRSSARETAARVAAGAVAAKLLSRFGISSVAFASQMAGVSISQEVLLKLRSGKISREAVLAEISSNPLAIPDDDAAKLAMERLDALKNGLDSAGGTVDCVVTGLPVGLGEPVFRKLDALLAEAMLSLGATKGFEIGEGFGAAGLTGSGDNDEFSIRDGRPAKLTNHSGGTLGGMSDGSPLYFSVAFKPTPSIARPQKTVTRDGEEISLEIKGRHDPVVVPRAAVVVECMANLVIADLLLENAVAKVESLEKVYG